MTTFRDQNWQQVFLKAAQGLKMNISGVEIVDNVDQTFLDQSRIVTYALTNTETAASYAGADVYLARPLLERMILQNKLSLTGEKLVITKPQVRTAGSSDTVFNVAVRYAFLFKNDNVQTTVAETEEERIRREEDEELERLQREEDEEKRLKAEKEAREKEESDKRAADEQRLKDEETRQKAERENAAKQKAANSNTGNSDEDQFPEEKL